MILMLSAFQSHASQRLSIFISSLHITPACAVKRVVPEVNFCFSHIRSSIVNITNFKFNQFFNSPVVHQTRVPDSKSSVLIVSVCNAKPAASKVNDYVQ